MDMPEALVADMTRREEGRGDKLTYVSGTGNWHEERRRGGEEMIGGEEIHVRKTCDMMGLIDVKCLMCGRQRIVD